MMRGVRRSAIGVALIAIGGVSVVAAAACGADSATSLEPGSSSGGSDAGKSDASEPSGFVDAGALPLQANGVVLVHAASFPAFRICFAGASDEQPFPTQDLMPQSNLPGVEVGSAVRFQPGKGRLGVARVHLEERIRPSYFGNAAAGPSCAKLEELTVGQGAVVVHDDVPDLSTGVHLMVLRGCAKESVDPSANELKCGATWKPETGNLALDLIQVTAFQRMTKTEMPVQLVQLSRDLEVRAGSRAIGLALGEVDAMAPPPFLELAAPIGKAVPNPPAIADIGNVDLGGFESAGLVVTLGRDLDAGGADASATPREVLLGQSLADIQKRSSPRSLPPDWFATASSYVVLSVGEIDPKEADGGPGDPRRSLHLLAVPLAVPPRDAGTDAAQ